MMRKELILMDNIKNIFCVGRNYADHAKELGNAVPTSPIFFSKPTHALVQADGSSILFPDNRGDIHHELEIVLFVKKQVEGNFELEDVIGKVALGIDFTLRDEQSKLKEKGHPWLKAKGFKNSAVITEFWDFPGLSACLDTDFSLKKNDTIVQVGNIKNMLFDCRRIIEECNDYFGLNEGDIIFTGTPEGVGPIRDNDTLQLFWGEELKGSFTVGMK